MADIPPPETIRIKSARTLCDGAGVRAENTQTTLTKKKMGSYISNLVNFGVSIPDDLKPVIGL